MLSLAFALRMRLRACLLADERVEARSGTAARRRHALARALTGGRRGVSRACSWRASECGRQAAMASAVVIVVVVVEQSRGIALARSCTSSEMRFECMGVERDSIVRSTSARRGDLL